MYVYMYVCMYVCIMILDACLGFTKKAIARGNDEMRILMLASESMCLQRKYLKTK